MAEMSGSSPFNPLASITRQETEEGVRIVMGIDKEVYKFIKNFQAIELMIEDEERRHAEGSIVVQNRLRELKDTSYRVEDVLDEWNTEVGKLEMKELAKSAFKSPTKVCSFMLSYLQCHYKRLVLAHAIAFKIKNLNKKLLDVISKDESKLKTGELARKMTKSYSEISEAHGRDLSGMSKVYGRDQDKQTIVNFLLTGSHQGPTLPIISIVGPGGIGKTALAQEVFDDTKVNAHFDKRIWVCASHPFEIKVAKAILERNDESNLVEIESLLYHVCQYIEGTKFLLILDDVESIDNKNWKQLYYSLKSGSQESRILVTTREENVAKAIKTNLSVQLETLSENDGWSLLSQVAFGDKIGDQECKKLKDIGKELVNKCKNLPIAIKILGSHLRFKRNIEEWQSVLDSEVWKVETELFPPLLLSYHDLPYMLRKCFSYCAIFPKNYEIEKDRLIKLWMSQNYLKVEGQKDMESIGEEYFENFVMRSFFTGFRKNEYDGNWISCKINDIVRNSFPFLNENECYSEEVIDDPKLSQSNTSYEKFRHLMIMFEIDGSFPTQIYKQRKPHSLLVEPRGHFVSDIDLAKLFNRLICLRTLDLSNHDTVWHQLIKEIPGGINKLIHLRYLNLAKNRKLKKLPETLCELYNLQTLDLSWCTNLKSLPKGMGKLINLRHILNDGTSLNYMPKGIERLSHLRTLREFVLSGAGDKKKASILEFLKNLNHLQSLGIKKLGNLKKNELRKAELKPKESLHDLFLSFKRDEVNEKANTDDENVLEGLVTLTSLKRLEIFYYCSSTMSSNLISLLHNLRLMLLDHCMNFEHLPSLGNLKSLESLIIRNMKRVRKVGNEFLGTEINAKSSPSSVTAFGSLKYLEFQCLKEWNEWNYENPSKIEGNDISIMPRLGFLKIDNCPRLETLPDYVCQNDLKSSLPCILKKCYYNERRRYNGQKTDEGLERSDKRAEDRFGSEGPAGGTSP